MISKIVASLTHFFTSIGANTYYTAMLSQGLTLVLVLIFGFLLMYLARFIIKKTIYKAILKTESKYDDQIINNKVLMRLCLMIPAVLLMKSYTGILPDFPNVQHFVLNFTIIYIIVVITMVLFSVVNAGSDIYDMHQTAKMKPMKGLVQTIKIILIIFCVLLIISFLMGKKVSSVIIGLGTMSAVLLLIFQNTILGFVGSIQLTVNDMLRIGDWIVMGDADGTVTEINLTTVKVQNFDNTITTIPTSSMVTNQFTNWRGMAESDGRRIKRSITIDTRSIQFCTPKMIERYKKIERVRPYLEQKERDIAEYNQANQIDTSQIINGRQQTNLGVFRAYITAYLKSNPNLNQNMTRMVRQLQPTEFGVPLEVYVFSLEKDWTRYEEIQSDLFDHIMAAAPLFDLKIYQRL
ncbi:MAG: mechanosensitive ion channel family protein [Bacteroidales bacterium]|nr:mechanosensitive ion channel family protein [Bacteroidales bacterium]